MTKPVEVFADIGCPFTHVGLRLVTRRLRDAGSNAECLVRAWPLEWVNDAPLDPQQTALKIEALRTELGEDHFPGFRPDRFPSTTIPALNLAANAYGRDAATGLTVSLELRNALFGDGLDIADPDILAAIAEPHGLSPPPSEPTAAVTADYEEGRRRGVVGSPHFFIGEADFFCPSLDLGRDDEGHLTAAIAREWLDEVLVHCVG